MRLIIDSKIEQSLSSIYFIHITPIAPKDGVMIPGNSYLFTSFGSKFQGDLLAKAVFTANGRHTLHWTLNHAVENHNASDISKHEIGIAEPGRLLFPFLNGGYPEDYYSVGPYALSAASTVFCPAKKLDTVKRELGLCFRGSIITYLPEIGLHTTIRQHVRAKLGPVYPIIDFNQKIAINFRTACKELLGITQSSLEFMQLRELVDPNFFKQNPFYLREPNQERRAITPFEITAENYAKIEVDVNAEPDQLVVTLGDTTVPCKKYFADWHKAMGAPMEMHVDSFYWNLENHGRTIQGMIEHVCLQGMPMYINQEIIAGERADAVYTLQNFFKTAVADSKQQVAQVKQELSKPHVSPHALQYLTTTMQLRTVIWFKLLTKLQKQLFISSETFESVLGEISLPLLDRPVNVEVDLDYLKSLNPKVTSYGHAMRLWAAKQLPGWVGSEIHKQQPSCINEAGAGSGKTALDFAESSKHARALQELTLWKAQRGNPQPARNPAAQP